MKTPMNKLLDLVATKANSQDLLEENRFLKQVIVEAAEIISRYLGSDETFTDDPENYGYLLFELASSDNIILSNTFS
jgi:hypothetical protein